MAGPIKMKLYGMVEGGAQSVLVKDFFLKTEK